MPAATDKFVIILHSMESYPQRLVEQLISLHTTNQGCTLQVGYPNRQSETLQSTEIASSRAVGSFYLFFFPGQCAVPSGDILKQKLN